MKTVHTIKIDSRDNVATLCEKARKGDVVQDNGRTIELLQDGNLGDKIALAEIAVGEPVIKYSGVIGSCTHPIQTGEWVHGHNLASNFMNSTGSDHHE